MAGEWYTRPVFFVTDVHDALGYYLTTLGFTKSWDYTDEGQTIVAQVDRGSGCEIILAADSQKAGKSRVFISLSDDDLEALQAEFALKDIPMERTWWGYPVIQIRDPDGNELLFPMEES